MRAFIVEIEETGPQPVDLGAMLRARGLKCEVTEVDARRETEAWRHAYETQKAVVEARRRAAE